MDEQGLFHYFFLFVIYLFVNSEVAFTRIFKDISGASDDGATTNTYGTFLQALLLVLLYFIIVQLKDYFWSDDDDYESDDEYDEGVEDTSDTSNFKSGPGLFEKIKSTNIGSFFSNPLRNRV
jgi:hypothetical protein